MYVQIIRGMNKGHTVRVIGRWARGLSVVSPNGGREWTLNAGDYTVFPCRQTSED